MVREVEFTIFVLIKIFCKLLDNSLREPKYLPCLQLDDGSQFFMTDAAIKYLMNGIEEDSDIRSQVCKNYFNWILNFYLLDLVF